MQRTYERGHWDGVLEQLNQKRERLVDPNWFLPPTTMKREIATPDSPYKVGFIDGIIGMVIFTTYGKNSRFDLNTSIYSCIS